MSARPVFTSTTNVPSVAVEVVEHVPSTTLRISSPQYGLKTAAKTVHDAEAKKAQRAEFEAQKAAVLNRQWTKDVARKQALLDQILEDIVALEKALVDPAVADSRKVTIEATRVRLAKKSDTIHDEIEVLEAKLAPATA